jgi:hypothetical protein
MSALRRFHRCWTTVPLVAAVIAAVALSEVPAADSAGAKVPPASQYAPAADLLAQVDYYLEKLQSDLADENRYSTEYQDRVAKDANTLAVLALVLGMHDEPNRLKQAAPRLIAASQALAEAAGSHSAARQALAEVQQALHSTSEESLEWEPVGDLAQLMKQVPIVNNNLRRSVTSRRFGREIDKVTGFAATLAAIAQATRNDTDYCSSDDDERQWAAISDAMRDAAGEVLAAARNNDQSTANKALEKIVHTCDACHAEFRG